VPKPRMKDFYDIWLLSQSFPFDDDRLARAVAATFERRGPRSRPNCRTRLPQPSPKMSANSVSGMNVFLENVALHPCSLADVIVAVAGFIMPHAIAAAKIGRNR